MISDRAGRIGSFLAMDLLAKAREFEKQGRDIVHMELGEPDRSPPPHVVSKAIEALHQGYSTYTPTQGTCELCDAVSRFYRRHYRIEIDPDRIIITMGVSPALFLVFSTLLNPGDEVLIHEPYYPPYPQCIEFLGGRARKAQLDASDGFRIDSDHILSRISPDTKAILINSPSNPTGMMADRSTLQALSDCGITIVSDEIYHRITYGVDAASILEYTDNCYVMNGFSKVYGMTGWRLGWVICPEEAVSQMRKIHQNFFLSANSFVQRASVEALEGEQDYVDETIAIYDKRRKYLIKELNRLGWKLASDPVGAFYILADISSTGLDGMKLAHRLIAEAGVAVTPGIDFGTVSGNYVRFSYATALERIKEGIGRIEDWLVKRVKTS